MGDGSTQPVAASSLAAGSTVIPARLMMSAAISSPVLLSRSGGDKISAKRFEGYVPMDFAMMRSVSVT